MRARRRRLGRCWGANDQGQLGTGTTLLSTIPMAVTGLTTATAISLGRASACAVLDEGGVQCWGSNDYGQLGDGTTVDRSTPVDVDGMTTAVGVAVGNGFSCALLADQTVSCWGLNYRPARGMAQRHRDPPRRRCRRSRTRAPWRPAISMRARSATPDRSSAGATTPRVRSTRETTSEREPPTDVEGVADVRQLSLSGGVSCAIVDAGDVTCWGGAYDVLPLTTIAGIPAEVVDLSAIRRDAGCAVLVDGTVACWELVSR